MENVFQTRLHRRLFICRYATPGRVRGEGAPEIEGMEMDNAAPHFQRGPIAGSVLLAIQRIP